MPSLVDMMQVSASGLSAERTRLELISENIANGRATRSDSGGPYRRKLAVFESVPTSSSDSFASLLEEKLHRPLVTEVVEDQRPFTTVHDPGHPDADPVTGLVEHSNVDVVREMVDLMAASRAYEANVTAVGATKAMALKALEIGR